MNLETIRSLRQALLDNAAGNPLAQVHRNNLFKLLDESELFLRQKAAFDEVVAEEEPMP